MVLSVHASVGGGLAAIASLNPVSALFAGFISHFLLDAIPHRDYPLRSKERDERDRTKDKMHFDRRFAFDLLVVGSDCLAAFIILAAMTFGTALFWPVFFGAVGGVLPDFLQFLYFATKNTLLERLRWFHVVVMHTDKELENVWAAFFGQFGIFVCGLALVAVALCG